MRLLLGECSGAGGWGGSVLPREEAEQVGDADLHDVDLGLEASAEGEEVRQGLGVEEQVVRELESRGVLQEALGFVLEAEDLAAGKKVYDTNCVACHGGKMEGGIGPSFVDDEWIHGDSLDDIVKVVTEGVPEKGMITWGPILGPEKVQQVSAYVHTVANQ